MKYELLNDNERTELPIILSKRNIFRKMVRVTLENFDKISSNLLILSGQAGSGKTFIIEELLNTMREERSIADYNRVTGHITPMSMFKLLEQTKDSKNGKPQVLVLDDTDMLNDDGVVELCKGAFDTRSNLPTNRKVYYMSQDGNGRNAFRYNGFGIIITNCQFDAKDINVHTKAVLDRGQILSVDLTQKDAIVFTTSLIEDYLNENPDNLTEKQIENAVKLFNTDIRKWIENDCFNKARVDFSIRLMKKFIDCARLYGEDWKMYSVQYQKLNTALTLNELSKGNDVELPIKKDNNGAIIIKKRGRGRPRKNTENISEKVLTKNQTEVIVKKRGRGRPRKNVA